MTSNLSTFGFAHCCGVVPILSTVGGLNATCPACKHKQAVWGGLNFLRHHWNREFNGKSPEINNRDQLRDIKPSKLEGLSDGWRSGGLEIRHVSWGRTNTLFRCDDILFYTDRSTESLLLADGDYECSIGEDRHLISLELASSKDNIIRLKFKQYRRAPYSYAYANRWYCTDGYWGFNIDMCIGHASYLKQLQPWIDSAKAEYKIS